MGKRRRATDQFLGIAKSVGKQYVKKFVRDLVRAPKRPRTRRRTDARKGMKYRKSYKGRLTKKVVDTKLRKFCSFMKAMTATHTRRVRTAGRLGANPKLQGVADLCFTASDLEGHMANLRFYDPGTNALVTANAATGTYDRDIEIGIYRSMIVKNNYHVPAKVQIFSCTPKDTTNNDPVTCWDAGLTDQGVGLLKTNALSKVSDSRQLKDIWSCKKVLHKTMSPGEQISVSNSVKRIVYDFARADLDTNDYQKKLGGHCWLVIVHGVLSHDSTVLAEQGLGSAGIDYLSDITMKFTYDAGKDVEEYSYSDNSDTFTNIARISQKPLAAQQNYLV